mgnify:FL=1
MDSSSPGLFTMNDSDETVAHHTSTDGDSSSSRGVRRYIREGAPLAVRMRPRTLDEVVGQQHLLGEGSPLRRLIEGEGVNSVILYGPPGTGKTTLASLISGVTGRKFVELSALSAGVKEVRQVIDDARTRLAYGVDTVLFIDEVHRFSRTQQEALLAAVENRVVLLVAATTENPSFSVVAPLLSRSLVLQLKPLKPDDLRILLERAVSDPRGFGGHIEVEDAAYTDLVRLAGGDARRALTYLEAAADARFHDDDPLTVSDIECSTPDALARYDRNGDQHYDTVSAFIKSVRGSDPDAALHYLARMINAGEDPRFIARRLIILASEDIGLADSTALQTAVAAAQAVQMIGMPEGRIILSEATLHLATAPKSNACYTAIDAALEDVRNGVVGPIPQHLRDGHYAGAKKLGNAIGYQYPHNTSEGIQKQQYPPDNLVGKNYYHPTEHGAEKRIAQWLPKLRTAVRGATKKN